MTGVGHAPPGKERICPHCRATILQSASICPVCEHSLRFDPHVAKARVPSFSPLRVEGSVTHPKGGDAWEYSVILSVRNDKGEEISRESVAVGALHADERRTFVLTVEVSTPGEKKIAKGS
jgi:hypothetical protein